VVAVLLDILRHHAALTADSGTSAANLGFEPTLADAELVTLSVTQALLGFTSKRRWLLPDLPQQPGYNKRLRKASGPITSVVRLLSSDTTPWNRVRGPAPIRVRVPTPGSAPGYGRLRRASKVRSSSRHCSASVVNGGLGAIRVGSGLRT